MSDGTVFGSVTRGSAGLPVPQNGLIYLLQVKSKMFQFRGGVSQYRFQWRFWGFHFLGGGHWGGDTFIWGRGHTTNTFVLNYRVCNRLYKIINT